MNINMPMPDYGIMPIRRGRGRPPKNQSEIDMNSKISLHAGIQREFVCQLCSKTYLSSPALYLHMKIKHQQQSVDSALAQQTAHMMGNDTAEKVILPEGLQRRGRGRPKRNSLESFGIPSSN